MYSKACWLCLHLAASTLDMHTRRNSRAPAWQATSEPMAGHYTAGDNAGHEYSVTLKSTAHWPRGIKSSSAPAPTCHSTLITASDPPRHLSSPCVLNYSSLKHRCVRKEHPLSGLGPAAAPTLMQVSRRQPRCPCKWHLQSDQHCMACMWHLLAAPAQADGSA